MGEIYLDNAATTQPYKEVVDAMMPYLTGQYYNPSSLYLSSTKVKNVIGDAKNTVADFIGANPNEVIFTSGASESNCTALLGFILNRAAKFEMCSVITTEIEHKSIKSFVETYSEAPFCEFELVGVNKNGFINDDELIDAIEYMLMRMPAENILVSLQLANNEIGTIQNIMFLSDIVQKYGCVLHIDATQAFGQLNINVKNMGIDMLSASAHKICGPKGIGILYKRNGIEINPIIYGSQMDGLRGGTENVAGIVGMAKAVEHINIRMKDIDALNYKRDVLIHKLMDIGCKLNGPISNRLPNNISVQLPEGVGGEEMLYLLDTDGIMVGTGSACNSHTKEPSYVLKAIGLTDEEAARTIRITISPDIDYDTINKVVNEIEKNIKLIKG